MQKRRFGNSDLEVSILGYGTGHIGSPQQPDSEVERLLMQVLEAGVNLLDTARGYDLAEVRLGRLLKPRRQQVVLSTKVGYGVEGVPDWTYECIVKGIDRALQQLQTDYLDIVHLHSCPLETLQRGEVIEGLQTAKQAGKLRCMAYSGENQALQWAVSSGYFDSVQTSVNLCDQHSLQQILPQAEGLGVIAKRPLANAFWRFNSRPHGNYAETYWARWQEMGFESPLPMDELALRFSLFAPGVSSAIVGTASPHNFAHNVELASRGPLPEALSQALVQTFASHGQHWPGEV